MSRAKKRSSDYTKRKQDVREPIPRFLIVCEGERTEPNYFSSFRVPKDVIDIRGIGENTVKLVQAAIKLNKQAEYDRVWCVFDRDSFPAEHFNHAISLAQKHGIKVAYSNEAFELWYLLHFHFYNTGISRRDYCHKLTALLGREYKKNSSTIYQDLELRQSQAIRHAIRLLEQYDPCNPASDNPSTTVHLLVQELNQFSR